MSKIIFKSYKFLLRPTKEQKVLLDKHFGSVRFIYNYFLNQRKEQYQQNKKSDNYHAQCAHLTQLKKEEDKKWLNEINSQTLQFSLRCLETAFLNFYRGKSKFPRFKSKHKNKNSFTVPQKVKINNKKLYIPKFLDGIKFKNKQQIVGKIKKCTISKSATNKYYVSVLTEQEYVPYEKTGTVCGIDLGLKDFAITSDDKKFKNHKYTKKYEKDLAKAQKHLARKQKGSNSYENQRRKVAKVYEKITNCRKDNLHKVSTELVKNYDLICLEDLNIKGMIKNHKLAKHISDASWGTFVQMLSYKADWNDKQIVKINRFYPSSKTCNKCGWINQDLKLSQRSWICNHCKAILDRDLNASQNILSEGLRTLSAGTVDYTDGDPSKTSVLKKQKRKSKKSEAHFLNDS